MDDDEASPFLGMDIVERVLHGQGDGAFIVRTSDGSDAVLKVFTGDVLDAPRRGDADILVESVRGLGYPAPIVRASGHRTDGSRCEIQDRVPGEPVEQLTGAHLASVRLLNEMQRGAAPESLAGHTF